MHSRVCIRRFRGNQWKSKLFRHIKARARACIWTMPSYNHSVNHEKASLALWALCIYIYIFFLYINGWTRMNLWNQCFRLRPCLKVFLYVFPYFSVYISLSFISVFFSSSSCSLFSLLPSIPLFSLDVICFLSNTVSCPMRGTSQGGPEGPANTPWDITTFNSNNKFQQVATLEREFVLHI